MNNGETFKTGIELSNIMDTVPLDVEMIRDSRISSMCLRLYLDLMSHVVDGDKTFPSIATLANDMGVSGRHIRTLIGELEGLGLLVDGRIMSQVKIKG